ncbi:hypothetical protein C8R43DRAFT_1143000 [Mycena crocata]|nr:hypothetical protein C8R43DRAFT_1143000 [Mycena crocata]
MSKNTIGTQKPPTTLPSATSKRDGPSYPFWRLPEPKRFGLRHAVNHLLEICKHLDDRPDAYRDFVAIMKEVENQTVDDNEALGRASLLFSSDSPLFQEFTAFAKAGHLSLLSAAMVGTTDSR